MDYERMLQQHAAARGCEVGCLEVPEKNAARSGSCISTTTTRSVFPRERQTRRDARQPDKSLASMGIYVFDTNFFAT